MPSDPGTALPTEGPVPLGNDHAGPLLASSLVAPSTFDANIQDVIAAIAPGVVIPASSHALIHSMRGEVTLAGEMMLCSHG